jgi:hypothetical protein
VVKNNFSLASRTLRELVMYTDMIYQVKCSTVISCDVTDETGRSWVDLNSWYVID